MSRVLLLGALVLAMAAAPLILARWPRRRPRPRREPGLNPHVPMPQDVAAPWGQCGCELVWRPCAIHDPGWPAKMERLVREP
jgi:hypothetical protein